MSSHCILKAQCRKIGYFPHFRDEKTKAWKVKRDTASKWWSPDSNQSQTDSPRPSPSCNQCAVMPWVRFRDIQYAAIWKNGGFCFCFAFWVFLTVIFFFFNYLKYIIVHWFSQLGSLLLNFMPLNLFITPSENNQSSYKNLKLCRSELLVSEVQCQY